MISKVKLGREKKKFPLIAIQIFSENIVESGVKHHKPNQTNFTVT
jgi:hypothetical protein